MELFCKVPGKKLQRELEKKLSEMKEEKKIKAFVSLSCQHCAEQVMVWQLLFEAGIQSIQKRKAIIDEIRHNFEACYKNACNMM